MDEGTRSYLRGIAMAVQQGEIAAGDEGYAMAANVLLEIRGKEPAVARDPRAGRSLEALLPLLDALPLSSLISALAVRDVLYDKGGSHVAEAALRAAVALGELFTGSPELGEAVQAVLRCLGTCPSWSAACRDAAASHVARAALAAAGCPAAPKALAKSLARVAADIVDALASRDAPDDSDAEGSGDEGARGSPLVDAMRDECAAPVLCALLEALRERPSLCGPLVERIVSAVAPESSNGDEEGGSEQASAAQLAREPVASRVVEAVLAAAPRGSLQGIYARWLRGHLGALALDKIANHAAQRLLAAEGAEPPLTALVVRELLPCVPQLLRAGLQGVVMNMAQASARQGVCQRDVFDALRAALLPEAAKGKERPEAFATALLSCCCRAPAAAAAKGPRQSKAQAQAQLEEGWWPEAYTASCVAQALLQMAGSGVARAFAVSLAALAPDVFCAVACDAAGSRALEAALASPSMPADVRQSVVRRLKGRYARMAADKYGSHCAECCYKCADLAGREAIAAELAEAEEALAQDPHGRFVLRACKVSLYRQKRDAWRASAGGAARRREMFSSVLEEAAASATAEHPEEQQPQPQQQQQRKQRRGGDAAREAAEAAAAKLGRFDDALGQLGFRPKKAAEVAAEAAAESRKRPRAEDEAAEEDTGEAMGAKQDEIDDLFSGAGPAGKAKVKAEPLDEDEEEEEREAAPAAPKGKGKGARGKAAAAAAPAANSEEVMEVIKALAPKKRKKKKAAADEPGAPPKKKFCMM
eukprot:m51a1_g5364 putative nucleolar protein (762) ;mRNA; r:507560-510409